MAHLRINGCEQHEFPATLLDRGFAHQQDAQQVGGGPSTNFTQVLAEFLNPVLHHVIGPLNADSAKSACDFPEIHPEIVQQVRQLNDLVIRAFSLEKLNLIQYPSELARLVSINSSRGRIFSSLSLN